VMAPEHEITTMSRAFGRAVRVPRSRGTGAHEQALRRTGTQEDAGRQLRRGTFQAPPTGRDAEAFLLAGHHILMERHHILMALSRAADRVVTAGTVWTGSATNPSEAG
jgi:hypothetical protein